MATTTPNFGWAVPTSTDLVKDGAVAIETLGDSIDASLVDLKGGTTGQVLAKASGTDMDFTWTTSSAGMTNPMTTTGDTIYSSSGSTPARLAIGSTGNVLTVAGGVPTWAAPAGGGGMTQLATGTLSGATTTISSISGSYKDLQLVIRNFIPATDNRDIRIRFNGDSNTRYADSNVGDGAVFAGTFSGTSANMGGSADNAVSQSLLVVEIPDYANTTTWKTFTSNIIANNATTTTDFNWYMQAGFYNQTAAISSITLVAVTSTFTSGDYILYGVN